MVSFSKLLFVFCVGLSLAHAQEAAPLFKSSDYRITMRSWQVELKPDGKKKVSLTFAYEVPKSSKFILYVARDVTDSVISDSNLGFVVIDTLEKGETMLQFEDTERGARYFVGLWRGVSRGSPSGIVCNGAFVDFGPKVTPAFKKQPEKK